jgi:PiT family inorganic phosphate transporter
MALLILVIFLALAFDYINGFHDAANAIATIVSTKVLTPVQAVVWAASFNFLAFFIFTDHNVANTIAKTVRPEFVTMPLILCGLLAAIAWNLFTWWLGIPSSSSHTLIGAFAGAGLANAHWDFSAINGPAILKIVLFIFLAPLIGFIISALITYVTIMQKTFLKILIIVVATVASLYFFNFNAFVKWTIVVMSSVFIFAYLYRELSRRKSAYFDAMMFKRLQLLSSAALSVGHGGNDAQKVMGIITAALVSYGAVPGFEHMPNWVALSCYACIAAGTLAGGWKIVKTMGTKITKVTALEGVCAESAGAITLFVTEKMGIPVSTTHTLTGSIIGSGATKRLSAVRWGVTVQLLWAWILTIPVSAILAAIFFYIYRFAIAVS